METVVMSTAELIEELERRGFGVAEGWLCSSHDSLSSGYAKTRCRRWHQMVDRRVNPVELQTPCSFRPITVVLAAVDRNDPESVVRLGLASL